MDAAAVDRIVAAVLGAPPTVNRQELLADLESIASLYRTSVQMRRKPAEQQRHRLRIVAAVEALKSLVATEPRFWSYLGKLNSLADEARKEEPAGLKTLLDVGSASAFENLVGKMLRFTFESHFSPMHAGYSELPHTGEIGGPFVRFAEAALDEMGIKTSTGAPHSRKSIAEAIRKLR